MEGIYIRSRYLERDRKPKNMKNLVEKFEE